MSDNKEFENNNEPEKAHESRFDFLDPESVPEDTSSEELIWDEPASEALPLDEAETTRDFEPVSMPSEDSGSTRTFDTVSNKKVEADTKSKPKATKTSRAAKKTFKASVFLLRKAATYLLNIFLTILVVGLITGSVVVVAFAIYINSNVDSEFTALDNLKFDSALSTTMYYIDENGEEIKLEEDTLESSENRLWAEYDDIPENLINAYIAVEDQRFREHNGVDMTRTASAIYNFFIPTSSNYGGGSTITQQLIKNVTGDNQATIQRKVQEIFRALEVEEKFTKEEILEMYLNTIYLSHNSYGVRVAAETYFGKDLSELNLAECASIASIGKWPTHYDPISNPKNNLTRRNLVLKLMFEQGMISEEEFNTYYDAPIVLADGTEEDTSGTVHSYYIDAVMDDVIADLMEEYDYDRTTASRILYSGGLEIVTCLDPVIQECAEKVFTDNSFWPQNEGMQAQAAICVMDPETGDLLAIVGGLGEKRENRGLNRATQSYRQCGSSIKPVSIYALAMDLGLINGGSAVDDVPPVYYEESESYWPKNSGGKYRGLVSVDYAIQASLNTIVVDLCEQMGVDTVFENLKNYGYTTLVDNLVLDSGAVLSDRGLSALALGGMTYGVTVRDHTQAYATLANRGMTSKSRTYTVVRNSSGEVLLENSEKHDIMYSESTAAVMTNLLTHVVTGSAGTAHGTIKFGNQYNVDIAGKTGTTNDKKDVYFAGYTPDFVATCWYGYDNNKAITTSGNSAAKLFNAVFAEIYKYYKENHIEYTNRFVRPSSVVEAKVCSVSGKLAIEGLCDHDAYSGNCISTALYDRFDVPTEYCDVHIAVSTCATSGNLCFAGHNNCPMGEIRVLRKINLNDRLLHGSVNVKDAGYLYIELPDGYVFPTSSTVPFYQNLLPEGMNPGVASADEMFNGVCTDHIIGITTTPIEPTDPTEPTNPTEPTDPENPFGQLGD